jgi:N-acetylglucosaminyl-diphospho-decaprenol L-rhamnosyltransferase
MARIAVLVVAYRSSSEMQPFTETLEASTADTPHTADVYIIDNSGDPDEIAKLSALKGVHRFVASATNLGYGGGMNALLPHLDGDYDWLLVCNPDVRFTTNTISNLVDATARHPDAGLFGPLVFSKGGTPYPSARAFPSIRTGVGHALFVGVWPKNPWTKRYHRGGATDAQTEKEVDWLSGACLLVRPEAFAEAKGFDEGFFMYFEDVDLAFRLRKLGWRAVFVPSSVIVHSGAHSTKTSAGLMRAVHHKSARRYLDKKYTGWYLAPLRWALRFGLYVRREFGKK